MCLFKGGYNFNEILCNGGHWKKKQIIWEVERNKNYLTYLQEYSSVGKKNNTLGGKKVLGIKHIKLPPTSN